MTKRKTPTSREAFEKWALRYSLDTTRSADSYMLMLTWLGWQAALRYAKRRKEK